MAFPFASKNGQPRWGSPTGAVFSIQYSAKGPVSRILFRTPEGPSCGHSSRRRVAADTHQRPTRRFRQVLEPSERIGPMRCAAWLLAKPVSGGASLPIWSCSVWGLPCLRRYRRSGALLPHLFTLTAAWGRPLDESISRPDTRSEERAAEAVSFLWHWPSVGLETHIPDVIRHTALRSSDFPPPATRLPRPPAATARSSCHLQFTRMLPLRCVTNSLHRQRLPNPP